MNRFLATLAVLVGLALAWASPAEAQTVVTGVTGGGAHYKIVVPAPWNGDLVLWNHGFSLSPVGPVDDLGPIADLQLAEGYAVAASSFQQSGWALFKTGNDLQHLVDVFVASFGAPTNVLVHGASLGGIVTAQAIEEADLGNVVGAYPVCGALAGSRNWDGALDLRLVYDAVCAEVPGAAIPGGASGLPSGSALTDTDVALAVHVCTGILVPPELRSADQTARLATILGTFEVPESFLLTDMLFATFAMADLVHDQGKLHGKIGTGNATVLYGDPLIDATIARVSPDPGPANRLAKSYSPTGEVGAVRIVSLHTDKDGLLLVENESEYASVVPPANLTTAVVVETVPSHCGFTGAELVAGWEALRGWVAGGPQPTAAFIQALCLAIEPVFGGPCRIDPAFVIPDLDGRIRPR
jgi:hypothetical protein